MNPIKHKIKKHSELRRAFSTVAFGILLIVLASNLLAQSLDVRTSREEYIKNGQLSIKYEYYFDLWSEREVKHGRQTKWRKNGSISMQSNFVHGKLSGLEKKYRRNNQTRTQTHWKNGYRDGKKAEFDRKGRIASESAFSQGMLNGISYLYYRNGNVKVLATYKYGKLNGFRCRFRKSGKGKTCKYFDSGQRVKKKKEPKPEGQKSK